MASFAKMATETASTKRQPALSGGRRGAPVTNVTGLKCLPLDPVDAELAKRVGLDSPVRLLQTSIEGIQDVTQGDILSYGGRDYPIKACEDWAWKGRIYRRLILEDVR